MNKLFQITMASALLTFSLGAAAAKPSSITFESEGTSPDGKAYALYTVKCSDGQTQALTAWDNRKTWCVGKISQEACSKKQIRAAKDACK
jgi:hypothetical protein